MPARHKDISVNNPTISRLAWRLQSLWENIRSFAYGLWITRISVASVVCGALLFYYARQAQDLFMEVGETPSASLKYWTIFYVAVLFGWVLPVYVSARWILTRIERQAAHDGGGAVLLDWVRHTVP